MYTFSVNNCQYNDYNMPKAHKATLVKKADAPLNIPQPTFTSNPIINQIPFNGALAASNLRTEFISKEEISKYNEITNMLDKDAKKKLNYLLKTGALLNSDSNDNSTTLDNLYLLATTPRAQGLNNQVLLLETIETLADPHIITQQFGNIPKQYLQNATILANGEDPNVEHS